MSSKRIKDPAALWARAVELEREYDAMCRATPSDPKGPDKLNEMTAFFHQHFRGFERELERAIEDHMCAVLLQAGNVELDLLEKYDPQRAEVVRMWMAILTKNIVWKMFAFAAAMEDERQRILQ